jgi:hypothetical protein
MPATATRDNHHCTCLAPLGRHDTDRIISIGQGKYMRCYITGVIVRNNALNFANVNNPIEMVDNCMLVILKGEVSLYCWSPVWLVWNQLYDNWHILFLFAKQTNPLVKHEVNGRVIFPALALPAVWCLFITQA